MSTESDARRLQNKRLYRAVNEDTTGSTRTADRAARVKACLENGADPNHIPFGQDETVLEIVFRRCITGITRLFIDCPASDFNVRGDKWQLCPLTRVLHRLYYGTSFVPEGDKMCMDIYARMTGPIPTTAKLALYAIRADNHKLACALITDHNNIDFDGMFHECVISAAPETGETIRLLLSRGYRRSGVYVRGRGLFQYSANLLEMAVRYYEYRAVDMFMPFAELTPATVEIIMKCASVLPAIALIERCLTHDRQYLPQIRTLDAPHKDIVCALCQHLDNKSGIGAAMAIQLSSHAYFPMCISRDSRNRLIFLFLKDGAPLCTSMRKDSTLRDALCPWTPQTSHTYCSHSFRRSAFNLLLAVYLSSGPHMPTEMAHIIIQHIKDVHIDATDSIYQ